MIKKWKHYMTQNSEFRSGFLWCKIWKLIKIELLNTNGSENLSQKWEGTCSSHVLTNSIAKNHEIVGFFELF